MNQTIVHGWVSQPNGRGTLDIVWSCASTTFFCSYSVLCLNTPSMDEGPRRQLARKFKYMLLAMILPELILYLAFAQNLSARESAQRLRKLGCNSWTVRHAFYADMGGVMLKPPDAQMFPVTACQLSFLMENKCVDFSQDMIAKIEKEIREKNKNNGFTRLITIGQIGWFVIQFIGRVSQGAAITTLELTTLAFVACTLPTFEYWRKKPADIDSPGLFLVPNTSMETILRRAGRSYSDQNYIMTPLDFANDPGPAVPVYIPIFKRLGIWGEEHVVKPISRVPNDRIIPFTSARTQWKHYLQWKILVEQFFRLWIVAYAAIHLIAWNYFFPSHAERIIWLVSGFLLVVLLLMYLIGTSKISDIGTI